MPKAKLSADIFECRFLLASLHVEAVLRETTISRRRKRLQSMKAGVGLGDAYGVTLERIRALGEEKAKLAMATLTWVCHSERPLEVDELCHALAVEIGSMDFDSENIPSIGTLLDCCQGLITIDNEASTVRLIHFTVQEYLCTHPDLFSKPQSILAETCLTYLSSQQIKNLSSESFSDHQSIPFLGYSSRYWGIHANRELSGHARTLALELLNHYEDHISAASLSTQAMYHRHAGNISTSPLFSGLHCASFFGIIELVTALINGGGCEINQQDCSGCTPLSWAAVKGHEGVVKILLEQEDVDPNHPDVNGQTPLGYAIMRKHEGVVKLLLQQENVDPNHPCIDGRTPFEYAIILKHEGVVKLLMQQDNVDPNRPGADGQTPLEYAITIKREGIVKLLLRQENFDPNHPGVNGLTPLEYAIALGREGIVKLLLQQENVDPNHPGVNGRAPLEYAIALGRGGVVKLLLQQKNVDPNHPGVNGQTPIEYAITLGREGIVKLLLQQEDVDPNRPDKNSQTPISYAAMKGYE